MVQWLDSIKNTAAEIYLLGDILDYWYEYRTVVPRGYVRFLGKLAELSDAGVKLHWFIGNHDIWIFDYLPSEIGVEVIDGSVEREIMGKRFFLAHVLPMALCCRAPSVDHSLRPPLVEPQPP